MEKLLNGEITLEKDNLTKDNFVNYWILSFSKRENRSSYVSKIDGRTNMQKQDFI